MERGCRSNHSEGVLRQDFLLDSIIYVIICIVWCRSLEDLYSDSLHEQVFYSTAQRVSESCVAFFVFLFSEAGPTKLRLVEQLTDFSSAYIYNIFI